MLRKFVATFTGHEAVMIKPIKIKELMLTSFQLALAFPNISGKLSTKDVFFNGGPLVLQESIITTVDDLVDMFNTATGGAATAVFNTQTRKLEITMGLLDTLQFAGNSGLIFGFDNTLLTGPSANAPYPVNLIPFKSIGVNFGGMIANNDFQTITGESFDVIMPCNDMNYRENLVFYDREAFDNAIVSFRPSGGQINGLKMWTSVYLGGEYLPVEMPATYQSEFTFHITED